MAKMKQWLKRLWCLIVGCSLVDGNLQSKYEERTQMVTFRNRCIRCGKEYTCEIPFQDLLDFEPIRLSDYF
jgi:hypothetical protein